MSYRLLKQYKGIYFKVIDRHGPSHAPVFTVEATVGGKTFNGTGRSKAAAKEAAAKKVLDYLKYLPGAVLPKPLLSRESSVDSNLCADAIKQVPGSNYDLLNELNPDLDFDIDAGTSQGGQRLCTLTIMGLVVLFLIVIWFFIKYYGGGDMTQLKRYIFIISLILTIYMVCLLCKFLSMPTRLQKSRFFSQIVSWDKFPYLASSVAWFCAFYSCQFSHLEDECIYNMSITWLVCAWLLGLATIKDGRSWMMNVLTGMLLGGAIGLMIGSRTYLQQYFSLPNTCTLENVTKLCNSTGNTTLCKIIFHQINCTNIIKNSTLNINT